MKKPIQRIPADINDPTKPKFSAKYTELKAKYFELKQQLEESKQDVLLEELTNLNRFIEKLGKTMTDQDTNAIIDCPATLSNAVTYDFLTLLNKKNNGEKIPEIAKKEILNVDVALRDFAEVPLQGLSQELNSIRGKFLSAQPVQSDAASRSDSSDGLHQRIIYSLQP